ncbi:MAG TPA: V4R domain-containing protein [Gemmatimonadales bacterium]|jgi:predicted hydrocarbon binding protein|nr:V4R domain-containing protein [Gemmatimonadales bacterium]
MSQPSDGAPSTCLVLSKRSLHQLRQSLERDTGVQCASYLQEAGFAGGEAMYEGFVNWLRARYGVDQPAALDVRHLGETLSGFFEETGWGNLTVTPLSRSVIALDSTNWSEAEPALGAAYPSCHLSTGMLADFLGRVARTTLGVMEVECLSRGDARCRFLAGGPETLQVLYDRMARGMSYAEALGIAN